MKVKLRNLEIKKIKRILYANEIGFHNVLFLIIDSCFKVEVLEDVTDGSQSYILEGSDVFWPVELFEKC